MLNKYIITITNKLNIVELMMYLCLSDMQSMIYIDGLVADSANDE